METSVKLYTLDYNQAKTYWIATLLIAGNLLLPQCFHLVPQGGMTWLPIYFFTLIGAYKFGWKVGVLTAIGSPIINSALFGMPLPVALPAILLKSVLLALIASYVAKRSRRISILLLTAIVLGYQMFGTLGEWALSGSLQTALQDFRIGIPGMLLQIIGGYLFIKHIIYK